MYGVAILPRVLDEKKCHHMLDGMWTVSQPFKTPIDRQKSSTLSCSVFHKLVFIVLFP